MIRSNIVKYNTRRIDTVKFRSSKLINTNISSMSNNRIGVQFINPRRSYSTNQDIALKRLEEMKIELGNVITPVLKENVVAFVFSPIKKSFVVPPGFARYVPPHSHKRKRIQKLFEAWTKAIIR